MKAESKAGMGQGAAALAPPPKVAPLGRVVLRGVHGPQTAAPVQAKPLDRLRTALQLSPGVPDSAVLGEAAERLERLSRRR
jgi:hypothetical protein